ncbi:MAG: YdeI/OmpD-associated family protein [Vicinamibacterales bacterium]
MASWPRQVSQRHRQNTYGPKPVVPELPAYIARAIKANPKASKFFTELPSRERRNFVVWVHMAKRPKTRERRLRESLSLLAAGKRLGLK